MTLRRLAFLQWVGLLAGATTWTVAHVTGIGGTFAQCNEGGAGWGISNPWFQGTLMAVAASLVVVAEACSVAVFARTRGKDFGDGPPEPEEKDDVKPGRLHFFSAAAMITNAILLTIILLDGSANLLDYACRRS
jgi:hypothetical protein